MDYFEERRMCGGETERPILTPEIGNRIRYLADRVDAAAARGAAGPPLDVVHVAYMFKQLIGWIETQEPGLRHSWQCEFDEEVEVTVYGPGKYGLITQIWVCPWCSAEHEQTDHIQELDGTV